MAGIYKRPLVEALASHFTASLSCRDNWAAYHVEAIEALCAEHLPSGSGFDNGTQFEFDESKPAKLVLKTAFHHMDENGFYSGWTEHYVIVTPAFIGGYHIKVTGRNRRDIKDYIGDSFHHALGVSVATPESIEKPGITSD